MSEEPAPVSGAREEEAPTPGSCKPSSYNFLVCEGEAGVLYNSRTGLHLKLRGANASAVQWLLHNPDGDISGRPNLGALKKSLAEGGFLVPRVEDELEQILARNGQARRQPGEVHLTIAVTEACNFRCPYCFQGHAQRNMDDAIADELLAFVRARLAQYAKLAITWYGGEPLLNMPVIRKLSAAFIALCDEKSCAYSTFMITNAYRLTPKMVEELGACRIGDFQITIDGDRETHNRTRILAGGQGTFDIITANLEKIARMVNSISVRINVLRSNEESARSLLYMLKERFGEIPGFNAYLARVEVASEHSKVSDGDALTKQEFAALKQDASKPASPDTVSGLALPRPISAVCGAETEQGFVVDPDGSLFKCWNSVGRDDVEVGNVNQPCVSPQNKWMSFSVDQDEECRRCKFLPICMGGCPDVRFRSGLRERDCTPHKFSLVRQLTEIAQSAQQ